MRIRLDEKLEKTSHRKTIKTLGRDNKKSAIWNFFKTNCLKYILNLSQNTKSVLHIVWALSKNRIGSENLPLPFCDYFKKVKKNRNSQCSHCANLSCDSIAKSSTWFQLFINLIKQALSITQGLSIIGLVFSSEFKDWHLQWGNGF